MAFLPQGAFSSKQTPTSTSQMKEKVPKGYKKAQIQQFTPESIKLLESLYPHLGEGSFLQRLAGGDESFFEEMERPAMRQFSQLQGDMASRFSGMGMGARRGSGFQNSMNQATSDFAQDLASKRSEMRMNALKELMGLSDTLMNQKPFQTGLVEKEKPWWQQAATGIAQTAVKEGIKGAWNSVGGGAAGGAAAAG